ncbi:hypothetical protein HRI_004035100 [Hibiscus trionum]|uniref:Pectinesterase inhibitor domain-containing protein n=1 Tax=Hibiscus trionum TaxID=183268 RepID=A0A9W7J1D5_HIBTR|nr:hypothetical protein HRI_004035100 [Hibiscus trionum]
MNKIMSQILFPLLLVSLILGSLAIPSLSISIEKEDLIQQTCKKTRDPDLSRFYGSCIEDYGTSVDRLLPEAAKALGSKDYITAKSDAAAVAPYIDACDQQFAEKTPFSDGNKLVRDLSLVASSIIALLG